MLGQAGPRPATEQVVDRPPLPTARVSAALNSHSSAPHGKGTGGRETGAPGGWGGGDEDTQAVRATGPAVA